MADPRFRLWNTRRRGAVGDGLLRTASMLLCLLAILLAGCVYFSRRTLPGACPDDLGSSMRNFCVVTPGVLWRGAAPSQSDARWLVEHRIRTVVSLQLDVRRTFESVHTDPQLVHSIAYFRIRDFSAMQVLTHYHLDAHLALVLAIIMKAPKPVLVSCRAGVDRTGIIAAAYRVLVEGRSEKQAIAEMTGFHTPWDPLNARYIRSLKGARKMTILRHMRLWEPWVRPSGQFDCAGGRCRFRRLGGDLSVAIVEAVKGPG